MIELFENNDALSELWEKVRDEPGYSPDGLTNPLYRRQPKPPERREHLKFCRCSVEQPKSSQFASPRPVGFFDGWI